MTLTVKKALLRQQELPAFGDAEAANGNADHNISLQMVMGYGFVSGQADGLCELARAESRDLVKSSTCVLVHGQNKPGLAHVIADRLAAREINISFVVVQSAAEKFLAVYGFATASEAEQAMDIIKQADRHLGTNRNFPSIPTKSNGAESRTVRGGKNSKSLGWRRLSGITGRYKMTGRRRSRP